MEGSGGLKDDNSSAGNVSPGSERSRNPFARLKNLFRRNSSISLSPAQGIISATPVVTGEIPTSEQPYEKQHTEAQEILKPAEVVYFHAMPEARFASVRQNGLFGLSDTPTLSESLGYSLFLSFRDKYHQEYQGKTPLGSDVRNRAPEDYVLTIWGDPNQILTRESNDDFGRKKRIITTIADPADVPAAFMEGNLKSQPLYRPEAPKATQFSAENMMASIPLTKPVREAILKGMVLAHAGKSTATQIEHEIASALQQSIDANPTSLFSKEGVSMEDLIHNVVVSFEKELVEDIALPAVEAALKNPTVIKEEHPRFPIPPYRGEPIQALFMAMTYRNNVNEPVLAQQLDGMIAKLKDQMAADGVDLEVLGGVLEESVRSLQSGEKGWSYPGLINIGQMYKYYSYNPTVNAAYDLMKELKIV